MLTEILNSESAPHKSSGKFSISNIDNCRRKIFLTLKGKYKEEYDEKTKRTFSIGDSFHQMIVGKFQEKSINSDWKVCAAELNIQDHPFISGRTDLMLCNCVTGEKILVDIKSCSQYSMQEAQKGNVSEGYIKQLQLYLHFFNIDRGFIFFVNKNNSDLFEFEVIHDNDLCLKLVQEIDAFMINVVAGIEPAPCTDCKFGCKCCGTKGSWDK